MNGCGQTAAQSGFRGLRGGGSWGNGRRAADGAAPRGRMPKGGRAERRGRAEPEDEKKARWNLAAVERKGMRSKPPRCPQDDGRPRGAEGRWVRRQETEMDLTETYMKRLASCAPHVGKNGGAGVPRCAGRNPPRASACRNAPPAAWKSRSAGGRCRNDRASAPPRYGQRGRRTERTPPVGKQGAGVGGAAAAVGKRRRERDAELQIQTPRLTVRRYEKWGTNIPGRTTVGGRRRTSRSAVARKACVRDAVGCARGSGGTNARVSVFFIHIHPRLRRAGCRRGGKADRSVQRPVILVRCVGHGGGARGVGAVRRHVHGGASGTGRAGQRGERCAGRET